MNIIQSLAQTGKHESNIPVSISYHIIELFSAGLYTSPSKAIEELVSNSYDALATNVSIIIPANLDDKNAVIWVIDDGISMDADGLVNLWQIARSRKRKPGEESTVRPPIGKFGIGKLATYVLATQLTYVCKANGEYRAVTMDYSEIDSSSDAATALLLPMRSLTESEARSLLEPIAHRTDDAGKAIPLFGQDAKASWTVSAMTSLSALAQKLQIGRLKWVLSTALPNNPTFNLFFNGNKLESSRAEIEPIKTWQIGKEDGVAKDLSLDVSSHPESVYIDGVGPVSGVAAIYEDPLTGGKAEGWGRSHGIFVMVRGRLVNIDDALFGLPALSHGPFSRFRMEIHADGLDAVLRSTREAVRESDGVKNLQNYINSKFNETRNFYKHYIAKQEYESRLSTRISDTPQSLSRRRSVSSA